MELFPDRCRRLHSIDATKKMKRLRIATLLGTILCRTSEAREFHFQKDCSTKTRNKKVWKLFSSHYFFVVSTITMKTFDGGAREMRIREGMHQNSSKPLVFCISFSINSCSP